MIVKLKHTLFILLLAYAPAALAQPVDQWIAWGDAAMARGEYYGASRFYDGALEADPGRMVLQWKLAEACRSSEQYEKAGDLYERVYQKDQGRTYPDALRWLAEMRMCQGDHDAAEAAWKKAIARERRKNSFTVKRAENAIKGCELARTEDQRPDTIDIEHLEPPVNTTDSEFGPRIAADGSLHFASLRGELTSDQEVKDTLSYKIRVLRSYPAEGGWGTPIEVESAVNETGDNANVTWSSDGSIIYFTRCTNEGPCRIHRLLATDPQATAVPVPGLGDAMSTQPQVVRWEDREMLLFVSDRDGGSGGTDIWQAELVDGAAVSLVPLNGEVNSLGDERTPWFDPQEGVLYFSSNFHPGIGGFDIFISHWRNDVFETPVNAGMPVNSPANDLYPHIDAQRRHFYFSSNRVGSFAAKGETCCSDIYRHAYERTTPLVTDTTITTDSLTIAANTDPVAATTVHDAELARERLVVLRERIPLTLYFHNDDPEPRSWAESTDQTYDETFVRYRSMLNEYLRNAPDSERVHGFFQEHVEGGRALLDDLVEALWPVLRQGDEVTLVVRGHASPLARSAYNRNLSQRRIASLRNHLREAGGGRLRPYLDGSSGTAGRLSIQEMPFGEERAAAGVSDDLRDTKRSVYSVEAMRERRIEIEGIELTPAGDGIEGIELLEEVGTLTQDHERTITFQLRNEGARPLRLVGVKADCGCTTAELPKEPVPAGGSADITVHFNGRAPLGPITRSVLVVTDGDPPWYRLTFQGEVSP